MPDIFLGVEDVTVKYGRPGNSCHALEDLSLSFEPETLTLIMGPSGSGKTTLLSLLGCLLKPNQGTVYVHGRDVTYLSEEERSWIRRRYVGYIFQAFRLFHSLSALDNVLIALEIADDPVRDPRRARDVLEQLGLGEKIHLRPDDLSGGEKQRVAIGRALIKNPAILLADEPTASLDSTAGQEIAETLLNLAQAESKTVVVVSHDPRWEKFAHRIISLGDGRILQDRSLRLCANEC